MDQKINQLYEEGKVDQAIHALIEKIDHNPRETANYLQLATYLLDQGSAEQARELLTKARGIAEDPQALVYDLAVCDYALGDFDQALAYALSIKESDDRVKELIGDIWLALGELEAARASYLEIAEGQRSSKLNFLLGLTYFSQDREQAEEFFAKSKKQDPKYYQKAKDQYESLLKLLSQGKAGAGKE
ncbi:tetratricopeptide repeat protein [Lactobacillus delbrueckii subsp. bulgaricus]|nr:tetratricopeptide repeat protein [Lactobacillus delbrueckii subsp. bulgaricus]